MKKQIIISALALTALLCGCQKEAATTQTESDGITFCLSADLDDNSKTVYVPEGRKVFWAEGDKVGMKYVRTEETKAKYDNVTCTLTEGAGTDCGKFKAKLGTTNATPADNNFLFYYPTVSNAKSAAITDIDNLVLAANFPKLQISTDIIFDGNLIYGIAKNVQGYTPSTTEGTVNVNVQMKNAMSVLDFTIKGTGNLKRIFITDADETAQAMFGDNEITIVNGDVTAIKMPAANGASDRTIIAEYQKPIALSAEGAHAYVAIVPRQYAKGIKVCFELADGTYMVKELKSAFTLASNKAYSVPAVTFASSAQAGKGYYDGVEYSYQTMTDSRDGNVYRIATLSDGRTWMLDNLRFLPQDYEASKDVNEKDNGVWFPVVINADGNGAEFGNAADVQRFGYLYNVSVALGEDAEYIKGIMTAVDTDKSMTAAQGLAELKTKEGAQGICPEGWYVPTIDDYKALYKAPNDNLGALGAQGFIIKDFGALTIGSLTVAKATISGYTTNKMNMTYLILSTPASYKQIQAAMTNVTNNTAATANMGGLSAAALRCIKKADK